MKTIIKQAIEQSKKANSRFYFLSAQDKVTFVLKYININFPEINPARHEVAHAVFF